MPHCHVCGQMLHSAHHKQGGTLHRDKTLLFSESGASAAHSLFRGAPASEVGQMATGAAVLENWELPAFTQVRLLIMTAPAGAQQEQGTTILQDKGTTTSTPTSLCLPTLGAQCKNTH